MRRWLVAPAMLVLTVLCLPGRALADPTSRSVYVTVVDDQGQPVTGLTAADFAVKEGGKDRDIASVEPARAKMHVAVMIEETLAPMGGVRNALGEFVKRTYQVAEISLILVGQRNTTTVEYTSDPNALVAGINNLPLNVQQQTQTMVPEGIFDLSKVLEKDKPERPVIVLLALEKQQASAEQPQNVLNQLARSGAMMYVVSMEGGSSSSGTSGVGRASADNGGMDMAGRAQVMGDGPKQSGGRRIEVAALTAFPKGIQQIADDLMAQYVITYTLPDGVKPSDRLAVSLKKKGATLRAPTKISSK